MTEKLIHYHCFLVSSITSSMAHGSSWSSQNTLPAKSNFSTSCVSKFSGLNRPRIISRSMLNGRLRWILCSYINVDIKIRPLGFNSDTRRLAYCCLSSMLIATIAPRGHIASNWPAMLGRNFSVSPQYTVSLRSVAVYTENSPLSEKVNTN